MCYTTWSKERYSTGGSDASLRDLKKNGVTWVAILTTWYQEKCSTTGIFPTDKTPSDASLIHAINTAHKAGMKVMLKPHLDVIDPSEGTWRGEIVCINESDWQKWFESYRDFILHYAKIAQEHKVEMFCIGTELTTVSSVREDMWRDVLIKPVREAYKGPLTYAANWNVEYLIVKFWDALDYVGIDAYFPLVEDKEVPVFEEIKKAWEPWVKEIEEFQKKVKKPIIFPEAGYCSADGSVKTPWEEIAKGSVNMRLQAEAYKALMETFWPKEWFYGVYWWRWGTDIRMGGPHNRSFTPQNKTAQVLVRHWYDKPSPR